MNKRELAEIRRRLHADKCATWGISGCYVSEKGEIVSRFELPASMLAEDELERYLAIFRKSLTGTVGKNLIQVPFTVSQVENSAEHTLMMKLKSGKETRDSVLDELYSKIVQSVSFESRYAVLILNESYDVIHKGREESEEVFNFVLCVICPVAETKAALCYDSESRKFKSKGSDFVLKAPQLGFMFPSFDQRSANIYSAVYYTKDPAVCRTAFTDALFNAELPLAAEVQKTTFSDVLCASLGSECTYEVVRDVREHIVGLVEEADADKFNDDAPIVGKGEMKALLQSIGVSEEKVEAFGNEYDEAFGKGTELDAVNLADKRRFVIKTSDVSVKIDPDKTELVSVEYIDGLKYILIRIEDGIEVNGIDVKVRKEDK